MAVDGLAEVFELGSGDLGHEHAEAGVFLHPELRFPCPPLPLERVDAGFYQFLVGPVAGVAVEAVGKQLVSRLQQAVVGLHGLGTDFSAALAKALT